ncbi:MAG: hypothetical protein JWR26_1536 [Pedosphaera sp.]|nr:hypothetical protein [Pedosphaera sp.]
MLKWDGLRFDALFLTLSGCPDAVVVAILISVSSCIGVCIYWYQHDIPG